MPRIMKFLFAFFVLLQTSCFALSVDAIPYFWAINIHGEVGVKDIPPAEIDLPFRQVLQEFKGGVAGMAVVRHNCFVGFLDSTYLHLQNRHQAVATTITFDQETFIGTLAAGYTVGPVDLFAGARLFDFTTTLGVPLLGFRTSKIHWTDPIIGINYILPLSSKTRFQILADVGGFGVGSHIQWELLPALRFQLNKNIAFYWGYRLLYVNYSNVNLNMKTLTEGWIGGFAFHF